MVDSIKPAAAPLQPFTTIKYTTKDGEKATATKNNGIVTVTGEKTGVRQMPVEDFIKKELPNVQLEKTPEKDTVDLSRPGANTVEHADAKAVAAGKAPVEAAKENAPAAPKEEAPAPADAKAEPAKQPEAGKKLNVEA